jgi:hypothetical protein
MSRRRTTNGRRELPKRPDLALARTAMLTVACAAAPPATVAIAVRGAG